MSKARLVITAVVVEKRPVAEVAREYGVARSWVYKLLARYRAEGEAAFEPRSRRPASSPTAIGPDAAELIIGLRKELDGRGLDAGPHTIAWHLERRHQLRVSPATVHRYLARAGLVAPQPRKRPRSSWVRFAAEQPNERWQSDFTHWPLAGGRPAEILAWIDDHSRYALSLTAHAPVTGQDVVEAFRAACAAHGAPASTLTDNGLVFTTRLLPSAPRNALEQELAARGIARKNGKPNHPQTQGKVERFHQTLKRWLARQPPAPDLAALQAQLAQFADEYNNRRPHRSLNRRTPAAAYAARPKAAPAPPPDTPADVRATRTGPNGTVPLRREGRPHHIAIGRRHAGTAVLVTTTGLSIQIADAATGEILRQLTLDPTRDYQPTGAPPGRTPKNVSHLSSMS
jgi:transposase InsO family protein